MKPSMFAVDALMEREGIDRLTAYRRIQNEMLAQQIAKEQQAARRRAAFTAFERRLEGNS